MSVPVDLPVDRDVTDVLVMFKCHLDVGYTDTEEAVVRRYLHEHIPAAIDVAARMREQGPDRYRWTVPAWLLYRHLEATDPAGRRAAEAAIEQGDLVWHALPFTWYSELLDSSTVSASLGFSQRLDERFGTRTTAARLTDVPGHTRGLIAPLAAGGVRFLDLGCNPGCQAPAVPAAPGGGLAVGTEDLDPDLTRWHDAEPVHADQHTSAEERARMCVQAPNSAETHLFTWRDPDGAELTVLYHPISYGSTVRVPGTGVVFSMRMHGDNNGPNSVESVQAGYAALRRKFPNASVRAASLTEMDAELDPIRPDLPVVTQEIGDSWIYGTGSDPVKTHALRELLRLRRGWVDEGRLDPGGDDDLAFLAELIPAPEHNWGMSTSMYLRRWDTYGPDELATARAEDPDHRRMEAEWVHKRVRPRRAAATLPRELADEATTQLRSLRAAAPERPESDDPIPPVLDDGRVRVELAHDGSVGRLRDLRSGRDWCGPGGIVAFGYQAYTPADFTRFSSTYNHAAFTANDFGKPGLDAYAVEPVDLSPPGARFASGADGAVVVELEPPAGVADDRMIAWPERVVLRYALIPGVVTGLDTALDTGLDTGLDVTVWVVGKRANRRPEALWLDFGLDTPDHGGWSYDKLGQPVDPGDVIDDGGRHVHGVGRGVAYADERGGIELETFDAHLVCPSGRGLLVFDNEPLALERGFAVNLYNNLWGTAFPQWYDEDMRFRFRLRLT